MNRQLIVDKTKCAVKMLLPSKLNYILARIPIYIKKRQTLRLLPSLVPLENKKSLLYIVSLTSYGKRLSDTAPLAIITLLNQSVKPDKVILWVANEDQKNIPKILKKLIIKGLEIRYCEDIKSYKKLIPAIEFFPDAHVITADDDIYYPYNWLEQLIALHEQHPRKIICQRAHGIKVDENFNLFPYIKWDGCIEPDQYFAGDFETRMQSTSRRQMQSVFPTGGAGALYPPCCLHKNATNRDLFTRLAPHADDVWFWAMAVINKEYFGEESPYIVVTDGCTRIPQSIDPKHEQDDRALMNYNASKGGNDRQIEAVIDYFPEIKENVLKKLFPVKKVTH